MIKIHGSLCELCFDVGGTQEFNELDAKTKVW